MNMVSCPEVPDTATTLYDLTSRKTRYSTQLPRLPCLDSRVPISRNSSFKQRPEGNKLPRYFINTSLNLLLKLPAVVIQESDFF